jgi:hypothetical protein
MVMANISQNPCRYGQLMPFLLSKDIGDIAKDIGGDSRVQNFKMQISHELQRI